MNAIVDITDHQRILYQHNEMTQGDAGAYSAHRTHLTSAIIDCAPKNATSLCLLGAGNCNDVSLPRLLELFQQIHLVDIDEEALGRARKGLSKLEKTRVIAHDSVDLSGLFKNFSDKIPSAPAAPEELAHEISVNVLGSQLGRHEVVVSCCLMSQLDRTLIDVLEGRKRANPALESYREGVMLGQLRIMTELLAPGGVGIIANDLLGSGQVDLDSIHERGDLAEFTKQAILHRRCDPSVDPVRIRQLLRRDPILKRASHEVKTVGTWLWTVTHKEKYLVQALRFRKVE